VVIFSIVNHYYVIIFELTNATIVDDDAIGFVSEMRNMFTPSEPFLKLAKMILIL
jgi:hypothetical protein